jgi:flagellar basal body-associated protein FliL
VLDDPQTEQEREEAIRRGTRLSVVILAACVVLLILVAVTLVVFLGQVPGR